MKMKMKKFLLLAVLTITTGVSATEVTQQGVGSDYDSALKNAMDKASLDNRNKILSEVKECSGMHLKTTPSEGDFVMFDLGANNTTESAGKFKADFLIDIEESDDLRDRISEECTKQREAESEERADQQDWENTKKSVSDFGSQFSLGLTAYGLYGYGVGGYFEYRPNALVSFYVNGSYNNLVISQDAPIEGDPSVETASQEAITVGGEIRFLFLFAGYEHILDSAVQSNIIEVKKPTGAFSVGLAIPISMAMGAKWKDGVTPRAELGLYYKQFNDTIIVKGIEESNSFMGGFFVRLRVF